MQHYKGWQFFPHSMLQYFPNSQTIRVCDPHGMALDFHVPRTSNILADLVHPPYGIHNLSGDTPSGRCDPRNTRIAYEESHITVYAADGTTRLYHKYRYARPNSILFRLNKEILPNGTILKYHYDHKWITRVESWDPQERYCYASIHITDSPWDENWHATTSTGLRADYHNQIRQLHWEMEGKHHMVMRANRACPPLLSSVSSPFYRYESLNYCSRFLLGAYRGIDREFGILNTGFDDHTHHFRVHQLFMPVGLNNASEPVYELHYTPAIAGEKAGSTTVKNSDGTSIVYHFSNALLLTRVQYLGSDSALKKEKIYTWNTQHQLSCLRVQDGTGSLLYKKFYEYDPCGNPIIEMFTGDLTGDGIEQTHITKRIFSQDGRSLLLQEDREKTICFSYLPNTNLITSKLTKDNDRIVLRAFSIYDDCHNVIQTISDNGSTEDPDNLSDVTQRTSTKYALRQSAPFLHMPEIVEDTYLDNGEEKLLKKRHLSYDQWGHVAEEQVYDANGTLSYTIYTTYNERGDILSQTNCLGQTARYTYNLKGQVETKENFSKRLHTQYTHDQLGRLRQERIQADDGTVHTTAYDYDAHSRLIHKTDLFGNPTQYVHDPITHQVITTQFPPTASLQGHPLSVETHSLYDALGRAISTIDANGNTTTYRYNAYGSPTHILHPTGAIETFSYAKNGQCVRYTDAEGLSILYRRDIFDRILSKTFMDYEGNFLAEETSTYNAFHLLSETDKEGHCTQYTYDGAGRMIRKDHAGRITEYFYNAIGQLESICKHNGDNTLWIHYLKDLEGKILQERKEDASGNILYQINYSYDEDGNRSAIIGHNQDAIQTFRYDAWGRLIQESDGKGNTTHIAYDERGINALGQRVLQIHTTDPYHITTIHMQDAFHRTVKQDILNPLGKTIACQEMSYDAVGNVLFQCDHVYERDCFLKTQTLAYTYTTNNQVHSMTRAFGTSDARTTTYEYTPSGKITSKTLPSGITLLYTYHPLGMVNCLKSSEGSIHHTFEQDRLGRLTDASDEKHQIAIHRRIDAFGNVMQECFPHGLEVQKTFDAFNRPLSLIMKGHGEILYEYDPLFLRKVSKLHHGEIQYSHAYATFDCDGHLLEEELIGNVGCVLHAADANGLPTHVTSPYFSQECRYDAVGNCIASITDGKEERCAYDDLSQLIQEPSHTYSYDSLYNRTQNNHIYSQFNDLNEPVSQENVHCAFDLDGNQILKQTPSEKMHFSYDPLHRLISATSKDTKIDFQYDPLGRRLSKTVYTQDGWKKEQEHYLYDGCNEIGAFIAPHTAKNVRVLGLALHEESPLTVAIEIGDQVFAPILDIQGNVRRLVDIHTGDVVQKDDFTAFGEEIHHKASYVDNLWRYAAKRFDPEIGLIYFGKRYYDPESARWLTTDPAGFIDSVNLYQYVLNNPFRYTDPGGQFVIIIPLVALTWKIVAVAAVTAYVAYELEHQYQRSNSSFSRSFNSAVHQIVQSIGGVSQYRLNQKLAMEKKQIDARLPSSPDELLNDPNWEETSHPQAKENGHRTFENTKTGERIRYDTGKPGTTGHKAQDHWHRHNPNSTGDIDKYLDAKGNPIADGHPDSHLYPG